MKKFDFSVIIVTHNSELGINKSIDSIINQMPDFENTIEVVIVDNNSEDNTKTICSGYAEKYPDNIKYIQLESTDFTKSLNMGVENSTGRYITFLEPHDHYSKNVFSSVLDFSSKNPDVDLISVPIAFFRNDRNWNYLNYKIKKTEKVDLLKQPKFAQLLGLSTFVKRDSINDVKFLESFNGKITFFSEILMNNPKLGIVENGTYFSKNIDEKIYPSEDLSFGERDYENFIEFNLNNIVKKSLDKFSDIPQFIQFNLINHLRWILSIEKTPDKLDLSKLAENIRHIDDDLLLSNRLLEREPKIFSFLLKYDNDLNEDLREKLDLNTVFIDNYDIVNDNLKVLASTLSVYHENIDIIVNGEKIAKKELRFPQKDEYSLNSRYVQYCSIESEIPLDSNKKYKLEFELNDKKSHIDFSRPCNFSKAVGYAKTRKYLSILEDDAILVEKKTVLNWLKQEMKSLIHIVKEKETGFEKAIPFRIAYIIGYPFLRNKRIWFYMDRPDESDDNGLALFKYAVKQNDDIDRYFILSSKNKDYNEIGKIGKVIPYKSIKHRYLGMFVENIITSHPDNEVIYPFWGGYPFFAGLLKSNTMFLQHGVLKDNISSWLNKSDMNLSFFLTSATREYDSIFEYPYNYDEDVVHLLGLPRFDTLENQKDKKQIIIMPSWRRNLDHKSKEYVKENEFFKKFNSLINNEMLINKAKEYGYEIIFRPHPKVYSFIDLFDENDFVKIDYDKTKYQTLFNNGSLMVTDYSSVAFDFAYLYKPVIYYQYGSDYHFDMDDSYYDYEAMGFGEIVKTEDELINLIIEYMKNNCEVKEKYYKRIDEFFLFDDKNNCKRVHDKINEIPLKD